VKRTHGIKHWDPEGCFGCKVMTVGVAPSAMPSRNPTAARNATAEAALVKDLDAFKRMRLDGQMPKSTKGAAEIERYAESSFEVQSGQLAKDKAKGRDATRPISKRGSEWRRRTVDAFDASKKGQLLEAHS